MSRSYEESPRVAGIAERLINDHHPHLKSAVIGYVIKKLDPEAEVKPPKSGRDGKKVKLAKARAVPAVYHLLTGKDFIVEVDEKYWDVLTLDQQEAAVDHELQHCAVDEKGFYLRDHDVEEFRVILERHGFWKPELEQFVAAGKQARLPFDGNAPEAADEGHRYPERKGKGLKPAAEAAGVH